MGNIFLLITQRTACDISDPVVDTFLHIAHFAHMRHGRWKDVCDATHNQNAILLYGNPVTGCHTSSCKFLVMRDDICMATQITLLL